MAPAAQKQVRAATRYPYEVKAECAPLDEESWAFQVELQNISSSGIQIKTNQVLTEGDKFKVTWEDLVQDKVEGAFYLARQVEHEDSEGEYYYGLRYYKLADKYKKSVILILNALKNQNKVEHSRPENQNIFASINQAKNIIENQISGKNNKSSAVANKVNVLKIYEKKAFENQTNLYNQIIVGYAVSHLQCLLYSDILDQHRSSEDFVEEFLNSIKEYIQTTEELESKEEDVFNFLKKNKDTGELQIRYNESSNRLFYAKQALYEKITKEILIHKLSRPEQAIYKLITDRYDPSIGPEATIVDWEPSKESRVTPESFVEESDEKIEPPKKKKKKKKKKIKSFRKKTSLLSWVKRFVVLLAIGALSYYIFLM